MHRVNRDSLTIFTIILGAALIFGSTLFALSNSLWLFILFLIGESIFISQLNILILIFIEGLFSPLESQRTFPIIESAETLGGIVGGSIVAILINFLPAFNFFYIWTSLLILIIPILISFHHKKNNVPLLQYKKEKINEEKSKLEKLKEGIKTIKQVPFLKGLLVVIIFHWMFVHLIQFQYTKALDQTLHKEVKHSQTSVLNSSQGTPLQTEIIKENLPTKSFWEKLNSPPPPGIRGYEKELSRGLGGLHIIFSISALLVQLFAASRIIKGLGIINSFLLHPLVLILNMIGMIFKFSLPTAIITKIGFDITGVIFKNSYHSSYYALKEKAREQAKEILEGIAKPFGVIVGMSILLAFKFFLKQEYLTLGVNILIMLLALFIVTTIIGLRRKYTQASKNHFKEKGYSSSKLNAIEILAQKGHAGSVRILLGILRNEKEDDRIKIKVLESLGTLKKTKAIPDILDCFQDSNSKIRQTAVEALSHYKKLGKHFYTQSFSIYRVIHALQDLFKKESSEEVRTSIIHVFANLNRAEVIPFLLQVLKSSKGSLKANCIYVCGQFNDPNAAHYIKPYLESKNPKIVAHTINALWQFPKYRTDSIKKLDALLKSKNKNRILAGLFAAGEILLEKEKETICPFLNSKDQKIKQHAAIALAKFQEPSAFEIIVDIIINWPNPKEAKKYFNQRIPIISQETLKKRLEQKVSEKINTILETTKYKFLDDLETPFLNKLKKLYEVVAEYEESERIENILNQRKNLL